MRLGVSYSIPIGTTAASGPATSAGVLRVRIAATNSCYIAIGTNPTATVGTSTLISGSIAGEEFTINPGETISVVASTAGGSLNVTEYN